MSCASFIGVLLLPVVFPFCQPPRHGAHIVSAILNDAKLFAEWDAELASMANRIKTMRTALFNELKKKGTPGDWTHVTSQIGMFSYTGLTPKQVDKMIKTHHIYMLGNGRISMAGTWWRDERVCVRPPRIHNGFIGDPICELGSVHQLERLLTNLYVY